MALPAMTTVIFLKGCTIDTPNLFSGPRKGKRGSPPPQRFVLLLPGLTGQSSTHRP
jgi:hypothetical protein